MCVLEERRIRGVAGPELRKGSVYLGFVLA
jgi:hypothetical protein